MERGEQLSLVPVPVWRHSTEADEFLAKSVLMGFFFQFQIILYNFIKKKNDKCIYLLAYFQKKIEAERGSMSNLLIAALKTWNTLCFFFCCREASDLCGDIVL